MRVGKLLTVALLIVGLRAGVLRAAGSIFDDDWKPAVRPPAQGSETIPKSPATHPPVKPDTHAKDPAVAPIRSTDAAPPIVRGPVPGKAELAKSRQLFREVFAADLNDKSIAARRALAAKLLEGAAKCGDKPADLYVLLAGARQAAIDARDLNLCFGAIDALASAFEVDPLAVKADAASTAGLQGATAGVTSENFQKALAVLDELVDAEDYAIASKLAAAMLKSAPDDPYFKRIMPRRAREVEALRVAHERLTRDIAKLRTAPNDPPANQALGAYLCFARGDWAQGLPLLAKSANPEMKKLATAELAAPADFDALRKLADGWAAAAPRQIEVYRTPVYEHAMDHYRNALSHASGIQKLAVETAIQKTARLMGPRKVDLLAMIDPAQDALGGTWAMKDGNLVSTGAISRVEAPYTPPEEYIYHVEFIANNEMKVTMGLWKANKGFMWLMGNGNNKQAGFDLYNGLEVFPDNPTCVALTLDSKKRHTAVVEVYNDRIRASVDGKLLRDLPTAYKEFSQNTRYQYTPRDPTRLSVSIWNSHATFYKIDVVELSGPGTLRR